MNDHEAILRSVPLFDGIRPDEWERVLGCLGAGVIPPGNSS